MSSKIFIIRERFSHMGSHSGYDILCEYLQKEIDFTDIWLGSFTPNRIIKRMLYLFYPEKKKSMFYNKISFLTEIAALKKDFFHPKLIHVLYGEDVFNIIGKIKLNNKLVVTFHQPITWWEKTGINLTYFFKKIDRIIVLSEKEKQLFEKYAPGRVNYIPHGIDTQFFEPNNTDKSTNKMSCITVGHWLRDYVALEKIVTQLKSNADINFNIVISDELIERNPHKESLYNLLKMPNVIRHQNVSDVELRNLYQSSDLLLLPLEQSTANNAVLEAMACGLPVFTSKIDGVTGYLSDTNCFLFDNKDTDSICEKLNYFFNHRDELHEMGKASRLNVIENYAWDKIALKVSQLYKSL